MIQVVDLFCGAGGFSTGATQAGAEVVLAIDHWEPALSVHESNHPGTTHIQMELGGDIEATAELILSHLDSGVHFHLHGSPPCQAISVVRRGRDIDEGMRLVNWYLDLVDYMQPASWSMEQVSAVARYLPSFLPHEVVNAADYGVPQTRRRVIAGEGYTLSPTHEGSWISVRDALPDSIPPTFCVLNTDGCGPSSSRRAVSVDRCVDRPAKTIHNNQPSIRTRGRLSEFEVLGRLGLTDTATLQGFPVDYDWSPAPKTDAWVMVGNAVCPPVAKAIVEGIA